MSFDDFWKRFVSWGLAFALGLFAAAFFYDVKVTDLFSRKDKPAPKIVSTTKEGNERREEGRGTSSGVLNNPRNFQAETKKPDSKPELTKGVKILSKPRANYTDAAKINQVQGKVVLRVTFSANGMIGAVSVISGLPDGLTEAAINAAKGIKFEPATRSGVPYSVQKPVEYSFTIY